MSEFIDLLDRSVEELSALREGAQATVTAIGEHYSGTASATFAQSHHRWQTTIERHLVALKAHRDFIATARDNYTEACTKNMEMFG
ncbi:WXG100 family type VII secretion target [Mycolicibacterium goodii]|nr:WXG100 family type VII secretion target [Mycolicibacterium goodii]